MLCGNVRVAQEVQCIEFDVVAELCKLCQQMEQVKEREVTSPKLTPTIICSWTLVPTPGRSTFVGTPILRRRLGFPIPESSRIWGDLRALEYHGSVTYMVAYTAAISLTPY